MEKKEYAKKYACVVSHDGAGPNLKAVVNYVKSGKADDLFAQFMKRGASTTGAKGMEQPCDLSLCYKDLKKAIKKRLEEYVRLNKEFQPMELIKRLYPMEETEDVKKAFNFWSSYDDDPTIAKLRRMFSGGNNCTTGIQIGKINYLCLLVFVIKQNYSKIFSIANVRHGFQNEAPINRNTSLSGPGFRKLAPEDKNRITSQGEMDRFIEEVKRHGKIRDHYYNNAPLRAIPSGTNEIKVDNVIEANLKKGQKIVLDKNKNIEEQLTILDIDDNYVVFESATTFSHEIGYTIHVDNVDTCLKLVDSFPKDVGFPTKNRDKGKLTNGPAQLLNSGRLQKEEETRQQDRWPQTRCLHVVQVVR